MNTQTENKTVKHTPGPWRYCMFADKMPDFSIKQGSKTLAKVNYFAGDPEKSYHNDITEGEANAKLIAAAPELLEACKAMLAETLKIEGHRLRALGQAENQARAAIAKAEGEKV